MNAISSLDYSNKPANKNPITSRSDSGSTLQCQDCTVQNNGGNGIHAKGNSLLKLRGSGAINGNGHHGLVAWQSGIDVNGAYEISGNANTGVRTNESRVTLLGPNVIANNFRGLLGVMSTFRMSNTIIRDNGAVVPAGVIQPSCGGICLFGPPGLSATFTQIINNTGHGTFLSQNSLAFFAETTITGNTLNGVHAQFASGANFKEPNTVNSNGGYSLYCADKLSWIGGELGGIDKLIECKEK